MQTLIGISVICCLVIQTVCVQLPHSSGNSVSNVKRKEVFKEILNDIHTAGTLDPDVLKVKNSKTAGITFIMMITSLTAFQYIFKYIVDNAQKSGYKGSVDDMQLLDLRFGYSPTTVSELMHNWGSLGRNLYLIIEAIDLTFYSTAYRTFFVILNNHLLSIFVKYFPKYHTIKKLAYLPIILSYIDTFEDIGQCILTVLYNIFQDSVLKSKWWTPLVKMTSSINQFKWITVRIGISSIFIVSLLILIKMLLFSFLSNDNKHLSS